LLLDILTPIAKSWPSEFCLEANSLAIQILGGYGYTRDYPVEQYWRDNRLNMIHEGTHGIQALDLLGRKVTMNDGAALKLLAQRVQATIAAASSSADADIRRFGGELQAALRRIAQVTQTLWASGEPEAALAHATPYMQAFGHVVLAWTWLDLSLAAAQRADADDLAHGIRSACRFFFIYELPRVAAWLAPLEAADRTVLEAQEPWL
jgi:butyryl-CoA dehydrogenase